MKKFISVLLSIALVLSLTVTVFAHEWPDDIDDWTDDDWSAWDDYWDNYYENHRPDRHHYWEDRRDNCYNNNYYYNPSPNTNTNTNYNGYTFSAGILDVYDASTEDQAIVLARIINIYAHGVASQTQQACVGWAVMNSIDASSRGANVCTVAANFNYDYGTNTTDDHGRTLVPLARDIIFRWKTGRAGYSNNGRVLPGGYCWVWSTGSTCIFRNTPSETGAAWNFSLPSPYST